MGIRLKAWPWCFYIKATSGGDLSFVPLLHLCKSSITSGGAKITGLRLYDPGFGDWNYKFAAFVVVSFLLLHDLICKVPGQDQHIVGFFLG